MPLECQKIKRLTIFLLVRMQRNWNTHSLPVRIHITQPPWKTRWQVLIKLNIHLSHHQENLLLALYLKQWQYIPQRVLYIILTVTSFATAAPQTGDNPDIHQCVNEQTKNDVSIQGNLAQWWKGISYWSIRQYGGILRTSCKVEMTQTLKTIILFCFNLFLEKFRDRK